jgi:hypothetical protein
MILAEYITKYLAFDASMNTTAGDAQFMRLLGYNSIRAASYPTLHYRYPDKENAASALSA